MKAIVTGGAGFIGSHVAQKLIERGCEVIVLDDLSTGRPGNIPLGARLTQETVVSLSVLYTLFSDADYVFHLAAIASVPESVDNPLKTLEVNVGGTANVLEAARKCGVKKVVFASSSSVYGNGSCYSQKETDNVDPLSPYAFSKLIGEWYCDMYTRIYSLPTVSLRFFNVYGERQSLSSKYGLAVPTFINCAVNNLPLPVYGDGKQSRDYVFIDDAVEAILLSLKPGMIGEYNVGSSDSVSVEDLAKLIIGTTGSSSCIEYHEPRKGDPYHTCADISKIAKEGFSPKWCLEAGLKRIIQHD
jgi:UDP-glucose 4-epimerase